MIIIDFFLSYGGTNTNMFSNITLAVEYPGVFLPAALCVSDLLSSSSSSPPPPPLFFLLSSHSCFFILPFCFRSFCCVSICFCPPFLVLVSTSVAFSLLFLLMLYVIGTLLCSLLVSVCSPRFFLSCSLCCPPPVVHRYYR